MLTSDTVSCILQHDLLAKSKYSWIHTVNTQNCINFQKQPKIGWIQTSVIKLKRWWQD